LARLGTTVLRYQPSIWVCVRFVRDVCYVCLLNVLVGIFVQSTNEIAKIDRDFVIQEEMERNDSQMNQMRDLFKEVDEDKSGLITWDELESNLGNERVKGYFSLLGLNAEEAEGLFKLLDIDDSGTVGAEEFIMGCMRLKGTAKSIDLATMLYENKQMHSIIKTFMQNVEEQFSKLEQMLAEATE